MLLRWSYLLTSSKKLSYCSGSISMALYSKLISSWAFCMKYISIVRNFFSSLIIDGKIRSEADVEIFVWDNNLTQSLYSALTIWSWRNVWIPWKNSTKLFCKFMTRKVYAYLQLKYFVNLRSVRFTHVYSQNYFIKLRPVKFTHVYGKDIS